MIDSFRLRRCAFSAPPAARKHSTHTVSAI